ncbi:hypothetical protein ANN_11857 [Periplaneta americana]|uniref:HTH CENPB-type domain-containing protein n=1 Tax=Periplaneta americana TaxID=6978 RepID=A0ABQ8T7Q0_PERAM|nr:hypothetical protein ANN_11857 [Periplaneta americana]
MGESRNAYSVLVGRPEGKRSFERLRRTWEDNIKMDLREMGYDCIDWINLAQDRDRWQGYVGVSMNLGMPFKWKLTENPKKKVDPEVMKAAVKRRYVTKVKEGNETAFKADHNSSQIFSPEEENDLEKYLLTAARLNYGLTPKELRRFAYEYAIARGKPISDNWKKNNQASYDWERGFMHRHPRLSLRNPQGKSLGRGTAFNPTSIGEFFQNLRSAYHTNKFGPESIYNLDETGVTNVQKPGKGTLVTLCSAVNATGNAVPPFFVYPRQRLNDKMIDGAPVGSCAGVSPSGWMTGETFVHYWEHYQTHKVL